MNDPNGLCFDGSRYHIFFQYDPGSPSGTGAKCWGHFVSSDEAESWDYTGVAIRPDIPEDINGAFSGSAIVVNGVMHIFYTGNVEHEGDYDYVTEGREANQIHVTTTDGISISSKKVILRSSDYPSCCSCHVRDPKVWMEDGKWKMVLGARTLEDKGCVLYYEADDPDNWHYVNTFSYENFGYMWECPDLYNIDGNLYLGICPQGLTHGEYHNQNIYSSGYFKVKDGKLDGFEEYDHGFVFYAPQTFINEYGERILIGWMGIGDIPYSNPTTEYGWQHCLTIPRKLSAAEDGSIRQWPVINRNLCGKIIEVPEGDQYEGGLPADIIAVIQDADYRIDIGDVSVRAHDGELILDLSNGTSGYGRTVRKAKIGKLTDLRIIADRSSIEIFANGGRTVMSTRFYPDAQNIKIRSTGGGFLIRSIETMEVRGFE